jgi:hypothetical protein
MEMPEATSPDSGGSERTAKAYAIASNHHRRRLRHGVGRWISH